MMMENGMIKVGHVILDNLERKVQELKQRIEELENERRGCHCLLLLRENIIMKVLDYSVWNHFDKFADFICTVFFFLIYSFECQESHIWLQMQNIMQNIRLDWIGSGEIIAEGYFVSSDSKDEVHHVPLGPGVMKVGIDLVRKNDAFMWRPSGVMSTIEDAIGSIIV
ncbi:uncharacterized protein LOC133807381 isoform X2 [Humulus lupulus]|uniref:uncharacterized protein LOC133807381 isoform X2 n=1 Tax=Humulus lupulus TaxID=3486 RepID=UPI002B40857F|nr:uncharacterized protein LOC133807381 isoform X2 [Humulus lupulus]